MMLYNRLRFCPRRDYMGSDVSRPNPGFRQIQWGPSFTLLYETDYKGAAAVEPHSKLGHRNNVAQV
ncbi:TPA: hypothetical protein EYO63_24470 [Candidatus Poribacteria bacterium]|nr:hypothetical protein [Candidatus Poribacteria bacterium]